MTCIRQVRTYRGADGDTDHYLVIANFKVKLLRTWNKAKSKVKTRLNTDNFKNSEAV